MIKAVYKVLGKPGGLHFSLSLSNIVSYAVALYGKRVPIEYRVAGARVAVAGLTNAAGVNDQPLLMQGEPLVLGEWSEFGGAAVLSADEGYVRVTNQAVPGREQPQSSQGSTGVQQVFVDWLPKAAVDQGEGALGLGQR